MADKSGIQWTDATWNPIVGCSIVSPGCTNCYAMKMAARIEKMHAGVTHYAGTTKGSNAGAVWTGKLALAPDHILTAPLRWKRGRKIFVNSMGDVFHEDAPDEWVDLVFAVMTCAGNHTFQVLTKRADRMREYLTKLTRERIRDAAYKISRCVQFEGRWLFDLPLGNVWLGVSTERQREADERIAALTETPAAIRFISAEPLLGPIILPPKRKLFSEGIVRPIGLDWVIIGGESGPGARKFDLEWARSLLDQCHRAGISSFMKQAGSNAIDSEFVSGRDGPGCDYGDRAGGNPEEWPVELRIREFPRGRS